MRKIEHDPEQVIPDLREGDINESIIIILFTKDKHVAYLTHENIESEIILNWSGCKYDDAEYIKPWYWHMRFGKNCKNKAIKFIEQCWLNWISRHNDPIIIYICENLQEVNEISDIPHNTSFKEEVMKVAKEVFNK